MNRIEVILKVVSCYECQLLWKADAHIASLIVLKLKELFWLPMTKIKIIKLDNAERCNNLVADYLIANESLGAGL